MARTSITARHNKIDASKVPKKGLATKSTRDHAQKVSAAFQKKYAAVRATRPALGKGITVDDLMSFYFVPELKQELQRTGLTTSANKRVLCHRLAAWINNGQRLSGKNQRYVPTGYVPKPKAKGKAVKATKAASQITSAPAAPSFTFGITPVATKPTPAPRRSSSANQASQQTTHRHEHKWQYEDKTKANGPWHDWDVRASDLVEDAYVDWKKDPHVDVRAVKSGEWEYMVDFNQMEQQNVQHNAHTRRKLRRVTVKDNKIADAEANEIRKRVQAQRQAAAGKQ